MELNELHVDESHTGAQAIAYPSPVATRDWLCSDTPVRSRPSPGRCVGNDLHRRHDARAYADAAAIVMMRSSTRAASITLT